MKLKRKAVFIFLISITLSSLYAAIAFYWKAPTEQFQKQTIPSPLLAYGETGKILKQLNVIQPQENKQLIGLPTTNPVEFVGRASSERHKWLLLNQFSKYRNSGVFGYWEIKSKELAVPFKIYVKKSGKWVLQVSAKLKAGKREYPFFLDIQSKSLEIKIVFENKQYPIYINGMSFLQPEHHPLVYNDPIGFRNLFAKTRSRGYQISSTGVKIMPHDNPRILYNNLKFKDKTMIGISKYYRKQGSSSIDFVPSKSNHLINNLSLSNESFGFISSSEIPVLSIDIDSEDLYSDDFGILTNYAGHGRDWERVGYVRYFRNGEVIFSNFAGIRLQGGDPGRAKGLINFRLYFREEYGKSKIESKKLFGGVTGDIKRLAVKQSEWKEWPLNTPIAYDISRKIGALAPPTELHLLYVNGERLGLYYLVPHLGERQIESILSNQNLNYYRYRGDPHDADQRFFISDFFIKVKQNETMDKSDADQYFDIENLSKQLFSYLINATGDYCQGLVLKGIDPESRMFWYSWDMDHSYIDVPIEIKNETTLIRERWEQPPSVKSFFNDKRNGGQDDCAKVVLFRRLIQNDHDFKEETRHYFTHVINHLLTANSINDVLNEYQEMLRKVKYPDGDEYIETLRLFFEKRIPFLIEELERQSPAKSVVECEVSSSQYPVIIDGFVKLEPYRGYYFPGASLSLMMDGENEDGVWIVNGQEMSGKHVELSITADQECKIYGSRFPES